MKKAIIDTDILSMFLRGDKKVESRVAEYLSYHANLSISILTYYEILSGLRYKNAHKKLEIFLGLCESLSIIPLTIESSNKSAEIYASLRKGSEMIDDMDILIAGICLENKFVLVTNNTKHFSRIKSIELANWSD